MTTYISYHCLDYDLALDLYAHTRKLGLEPLLACVTENGHEPTNLQITDQIDILFLILRPEYLESANSHSLNTLIERSQLAVPILRVPISIDNWASHTPLKPQIDCTNVGSEAFSVVLREVENLLRSQVALVIPQPEELYINSLQSRLRTLCQPLHLLEFANYGPAHDSKSPIDRVLDKVQFEVSNNGATSTRRHHLYDVWKYCKSFILNCDQLDRSVVICHLLNRAISDYELFPYSTPIPILLNVELWDKDQSWDNWLNAQIDLSSCVVDDLVRGIYSLYIYGSESHAFLSHPYKSGFDTWLWGAKRPKCLIFFCYDGDNVIDNVDFLPIVTILPTDWKQIADVFAEFAHRSYNQVLGQNSTFPLPYQQFLLQNPIWVAILLALRFDSIQDISSLGIKDYYDVFIKELMHLTFLRNHSRYLDRVEMSPLLDLASILTEKQTTSLSIEEANAIVSPNSVITKYIETGILQIEAGKIRFSFKVIQDYFASKSILERGLPHNLPEIKLNRRYRRQRHNWDSPVIIATLVASNLEPMLDEIATIDPVLALSCIAVGANASAACYNSVIDRNVKLLGIHGDFRLDLALLLYRIDHFAGKAILLEIMRSGFWEVRQEAYRQFVGLESGILSGLSQAIGHLVEDTRAQVGYAVQRLGTDSVPTLFKLLHSDVVETRKNAAWSLGELGDKAVVPALVSRLSDTNIDVSILSIRSLGIIKDITCVPFLAQYLLSNHSIVRNEVGFILAVLLSEYPKEFNIIFRKCNAVNRQLIVGAIGKGNAHVIIDFLLAATLDNDPDVKIAAVSELSAFVPNEKVMARLKGCLNDMSKSRTNKSTVSAIASRILGNLKFSDSGNKSNVQQNTSQIVKERLLNVKQTRLPDIDQIDLDELNAKHLPQLQSPGFENESFGVIMNRLRNGTWNNTGNAAKELKDYIKKSGAKTSLSTINQILETLNDENWVIRWAGIEVLGWTGNIQVIPHLVRSLSDSNWKIRVAAIRALAEIGDKNAAPGLANRLNDGNAVVREAAAEALGALGGETALHALESAVQDTEEFVRLVAIESLGKLRHPDTEKTLLAGLQDKSEHVRWAAANGLSGIANASMVSLLIPSLNDTSGPYWEQKRICDVIIDILKQINSIEATNAITDWRNSQAH